MRTESGQSAIEFLMTYSYAFLIITISVAVLLLFFSLPKTIIPFQCNYYSGFTCTDSVLVNTSNGASLIIVGLDNQPGTVNISTFNAILDYRSSYIGFCLPTSAVDGQYVYCVANFSFIPLYTNVYYGTFNMSANYCANLPQNLTVQKCPASNTFIYSGSVRVQTVAQSTLTSTLNSLITSSPAFVQYIPITITNSQLIATPAPFQQLLDFPTRIYKAYINSQWNNVEFSTLPAGRGTVLEAWIEAMPSGPINSLVWVNLPRGIPANSSITIYANFMSSNIMSASGPTGEEAALSPIYGQYDNGALVFDMYDNFNGVTLSSLWTSNGAVTVNNGLSIAPSGTGGYIQSTSTYSALNNVFELNWSSTTSTSANAIDFGYNSLNTPGTNAFYWDVSSATSAVTANAVTSHSFANGGYSGNYVYSLTVNATNAIALQVQPTGTFELSPRKTYSALIAVYSGAPISLYIQNQQGTGTTLNVYWARIRGAPPNNVWPSTSYGSVVYNAV